MKQQNQKKEKAFTLIELLVVVAIIGILATVVLGALTHARTRAQTARAQQDLKNLATAFELYYVDNGMYPADVAPDVLPAGMNSYFPAGWPSAAYPGSSYDWDYWGAGTVNEAVQLSVRFCDGGICNYPNESWASGFTSSSAAYFCISGECRPWESDLVGAVPGYCFNC